MQGRERISTTFLRIIGQYAVRSLRFEHRFDEVQ